MKSIAALWEMKPVQTGAKALGAGVVACGAVWAYKKATEVIGGPSDSNYKLLVEDIPQLTSRLTNLWSSSDRDWVDLLGRLSAFRKFAPLEFDDVVESVCSATEERQRCYTKAKMVATDSFRIRSAYQKIIERVRLLRSIIEHSLESAVEDYDEVAVDINAKVEQASMDAIQDTA